MGKTIDITGQKFGKITALYDTGIRKNRQALWHCKCDCGNECDILGSSLRSGHTKSCGCGNYDSKNVEDLTGKVFNRLTVLNREGSDTSRHALWLCKCECGNTRIVKTSELKSNAVKECRECAKYSQTNIDYSTTSWFREINGKKFGRLTPKNPTLDRNNAGRVIWECYCDCGNPNPIFVSSSSLKNGNTQSCGCLRHSSTGEDRIAKLLIDNNINFKRQYTFDNLLSPKNSKLMFDFAIFDKEYKLSHLIEYDGVQHFEAIEYFGGNEYLKYLQQCDEIKNTFCKTNNIPLIRINYLKDEIVLEDLYPNDDE